MRVVVTGGAGFLGSHLCTRLIERRARGALPGQLPHRRTRNVEHLIGDPGFRLVQRRRDRLPARHRRGRPGAALRLARPRPIDYLELPIETMKVGSIGTLHALGLAKERGARFVLASTSRDLRRPAGPSADRGLLGPRQPGRPPRRVRRGQALRRGADDGLPHAPRGGHRHRADLQHLRPADAPQRRPRDPELHPAGAHAATRSPSPATAARPGRSATSTTWSRASCASPPPTTPGR